MMQLLQGSRFSTIVVGVAICLMTVVVGGCAQQTEAPTRTPAVTTQDQATQGSQVNVWVVNAPGNKTLPSPPADDPSGLGELNRQLNEALAADEEPTAWAGFSQREITVNINTGSTTPGVTGTATATATPTVSPAQTVTPELGVAVPIGVALPGGIVSPTATASGSGSAGTEAPSQHTAQYAQIQAMSEQLAQLPAILELLTAWFGGTPATATAPAD